MPVQWLWCRDPKIRVSTHKIKQAAQCQAGGRNRQTNHVQRKVYASQPEASSTSFAGFAMRPNGKI